MLNIRWLFCYQYEATIYVPYLYMGRLCGSMGRVTSNCYIKGLSFSQYINVVWEGKNICRSLPHYLIDLVAITTVEVTLDVTKLVKQ